MNRLLTISTLTISFVIITLAIDEDSWNEFQNRYEKLYENKNEEQIRKKLWANNTNFIEKHNKHANMGHFSYYLKVNSDVDLSEIELNTNKKGFKMSDRSRKNFAKNFRMRNSYLKDYNLPSFVDWRPSGIVTYVKNQGSCGSCWAFAVASVLEGQYLKQAKTKMKIPPCSSLSPQQLIDCDVVNYGCDGGDFVEAFEYVTLRNGIVPFVKYPYEEIQQNCSYNVGDVVFKPKTIKVLYNEDDLKNAVANYGPIAVSMFSNSASFYFYSHGIYDDPTVCYSNNEADHAMVAVGYGTERGVDYWILKNSWGPAWGENGYIRVRRGLNTCGIGLYSAFAN